MASFSSGLQFVFKKKMSAKEQGHKIIVWGCSTVTEEILQKCSVLFGENYGTWGPKGPKPGQNVTLSAKRLRSQYLFNSKSCSLVTVMNSSDELLGHAFVCSFNFREGTG